MVLAHFIEMWYSGKDPTNSQDSAPSKVPIVTSKLLDDDFLPQYSLDLYKHDFLACSIISRSSSVIWSYFEAKSNAALRSSIEIDG